MNDWTASQIKEVVGVEIAAERRLRDELRKADRRWIEQELKSLAKALELQAREYERRLDVLNHAHEEIRAILQMNVTRELFDRAHAEVVEWQRNTDVDNVETNARIKNLELGLVNLPGGIKSLELGLASQSAQQIGSRMTMTNAVTIIGLAVVVIGGIIGLLNYFGK